MTTIYLIPCFLEDDILETIPSYVLDAVKKCSVIFAENERTARRYLKALDKTIVIDDFEWFAIHKAEEEQVNNLKTKIKAQNLYKNESLDSSYHHALHVFQHP